MNYQMWVIFSLIEYVVMTQLHVPKFICYIPISYSYNKNKERIKKETLLITVFSDGSK